MRRVPYMAVQCHRFSLVIGPTDFERIYYRQEAHHVIVRTECGLRLQIALRHFAPFITEFGIRGRFQLTLDEQNRFVSMQKVG